MNIYAVKRVNPKRDSCPKLQVNRGFAAPAAGGNDVTKNIFLKDAP